MVNALDATFAEARQATTNIQGGLVLTNTIIAGEGTDQSGMTGAQSNDVAFWAGGTLEQAQANTAPVVINRNGNAKFGLLELLGASGTIAMYDSNRAQRLRIQNSSFGSIPTTTLMESNSYPNYLYSLSGLNYEDVGSTTTTENWYNIYNEPFLPYFPAFNGMIIDIEQGDYNYIEVEMSNPVQGSYVAAVEVGFYKIINGQYTDVVLGSCNYFASGKKTIEINKRSKVNYDAEMRLFVRYRGNCKVNVTSPIGGGLGYRYRLDISIPQTVFADNGIVAFRDSLNYLSALISNNKMEIKIKGETQMPGCVFAGRVNLRGEMIIAYKAIGVTISATENTNGTQTYTISNVLLDTTKKPTMIVTAMGSSLASATVGEMVLSGQSWKCDVTTFLNNSKNKNVNLQVAIFAIPK